MQDKLYDVIIIGGGPAGLSAAQYAARAGLSTIVLDKSPTAGALAFTGKIENYPGLAKPVAGIDLLEAFRNQAIKFGAEYIEMQVVGVNFESGIKEVLGTEKTYKGKTVIIATGSMGRKPNIPGEAEFLGKGVSYCAICDAAFFRDQTVCVIGDSEEAVKETDVLARFAKTVYLIAPSQNLNVPSDHPALSSEKLTVITGHRVLSIRGTEIVTHIKIRNMESGEEREMSMDGVFIYLHGSQPVVDFLNSALPLSERACIMTHRMMETSVSGVYAAGDVTCAEVRQVVTSAAFGCMAALSAEKFIHHRKRSKFDWAKS